MATRKAKEQKRDDILRVAAEHFSRDAYHEVLLDDIAADAGVGKGTIYLYFKSKEELFSSMLSSYFLSLVESLREIAENDEAPPLQLEHAVTRLVKATLANPHIFELLRNNAVPASPSVGRKHRKTIGDIFAAILERGNASGDFSDPLPSLTAQFIPAMARSAVMWGPKSLTAVQVTRHILRSLRGTIHAGAIS